MGKDVMQQNSITHLFYPPRCPICDGIMGFKEGLAHEACRRRLIYVKEPTCLRCGKPVYSPVQEYCLDCTRKNAAFARGNLFDGGASVWVYTKEMTGSIARYKYHGKQEYARFYADEAVRRLGNWIRARQPECITAVPLNQKKMRVRGFNQALLVAKQIGKCLKIPVDDRLLVRTRYTLPQKELNPQQRLANLQKAFGPGVHASKYASVLIVDDIYTTGSTMQICSMILKKCGVTKVWVLSLCIGSDY